MDLIERYLGAVRWNLPADKADDIVEELADVLASRIEDREEALGRPLGREELSALLREFGHPLAVAGRYHGQRSLIGPEVFPFYWFVLRIWLAVVVVIEAIQFGGRIVLGSAPVGQAIVQGFGGTLHSLLFNAALVTLAFAVVERTGLLAAYLERWKPEELPDLSSLRLQNPKRARRRLWEPMFEIVFGIGFLLWWSGAIAVPLIPHDSNVAIQAGPIWATLYWPVVALVGLRILQGLIGLLRPRWKPLRAALILGCTAGTLAIVAMLHQAAHIVTVSPISLDAARTARVQDSLDKSLAIAVLAVAAVTVWQCAVELWKLHRER
jgi:hypothetical protein